MSATTYVLRYDGLEFTLSQGDYDRLTKVYRTGFSVSGVLFEFTPVMASDPVVISIGSGARFVITKKADLPG
jgi:hypothetical protein